MIQLYSYSHTQVLDGRFFELCGVNNKLTKGWDGFKLGEEVI